MPGFITDALGIALLVPPLRSLMLEPCCRALPAGAAPRSHCRAPPAAEPARPIVIEGTYQRLDDDRDPQSAKPVPASDIVAAGAAC